MKWYTQVSLVMFFSAAVMFSFLHDYVQLAQGKCKGYSFGVFCDFCGLRPDQRDADCNPTVATADIECDTDYYGHRCTFTCRAACPSTIAAGHCHATSDCSDVFLYLNRFVIRDKGSVVASSATTVPGPARRRLLSVEPPPISTVTPSQGKETKGHVPSSPAFGAVCAVADCGDAPCTYIVRGSGVEGRVDSAYGLRWWVPQEDMLTCYCGGTAAPHRLYMNAWDVFVSSCDIEPPRVRIKEVPCDVPHAYVHLDGMCRCIKGYYDIGHKPTPLCVRRRGHIVHIGPIGPI